jgi:hypothetical protein
MTCFIFNIKKVNVLYFKSKAVIFFVSSWQEGILSSIDQLILSNEKTVDH